LGQRANQNICEIGAALIEVKETLEHGRFRQWLAAEFAWSDQTALNFMNVARRFGQMPNRLAFDMRATYLLGAGTTPQEAVDEALARAAKGELITYPVAREIVDTFKMRKERKPRPVRQAVTDTTQPESVPSSIEPEAWDMLLDAVWDAVNALGQDKAFESNVHDWGAKARLQRAEDLDSLVARLSWAAHQLRQIRAHMLGN